MASSTKLAGIFILLLFAVNKSQAQCAEPTISDGSTDCGASKVDGDTCAASCNTGFFLTGSATLTCSDDGSGTLTFGTLPTCAAITCDTAPTTTGGSNTCTASTAYDATCTATCDSGFYSATTTYTCGDSDGDGVGDFNSITCAAITCDTAPTTTGGSNDCTASTAHAGTCTATCDSGFYSATTTYTCGDSDNDGVGDFNSITCAASSVVCSNAVTVANGATDCGTTTAISGTCTLTCDAGYTINGAATGQTQTLTCQEDANAGDNVGDFGTLPTCSQNSAAAVTGSAMIMMSLATMVQFIFTKF